MTRQAAFEQEMEARTREILEYVIASQVAGLRASVLYEKDQVARQANDILLIEFTEEQLEEQGVVSWISMTRGEGWIVRYAREQNGRWVPAFDVEFPEEGVPRSTVDPEAPFTKVEQQMLDARSTAVAAIEESCESPYNTYVLADDEGDGWRVYFLRALTDDFTLPIGGSLLFQTSADGQTIVSQRKFSEECLTILLEPPADGSELEGIYTVHEMDPWPVEPHYFYSRLFPLPVLIEAGTVIWKLEQGELKQMIPAGSQGGLLQLEQGTFLNLEIEPTSGPGS